VDESYATLAIARLPAAEPAAAREQVPHAQAVSALLVASSASGVVVGLSGRTIPIVVLAPA
jgi:hypothetical protein